MRTSRSVFTGLSFALVTSLAALVACGGAEPTPATPESTSAAASTSATPVASTAATASATPAPVTQEAVVPTPPPAVYKLIAPGADPKTALRYKLASMKDQDGLFDIRMSLQMTIEGKELPAVALPTMRATMHFAALPLTATGDLPLTFEIKNFEVLGDSKLPAEAIKGLKAEVAKANGLKGSSVITPRGQNKEVVFEVPKDVDPKVQQMIESLRQQIADLVVELPEEPVGKGAKWEKSGPLVAGGATVTQTTAFTLVDAKGTTAHLKSDVSQTASAQDINSPSLPPNTRVRLESIESKGTGDNTVDLAKFIGKATAKVTSKSVMKITSGDNAQSMQMLLNIELSTSAKK